MIVQSAQVLEECMDFTRLAKLIAADDDVRGSTDNGHDRPFYCRSASAGMTNPVFSKSFKMYSAKASNLFRWM